MIHSLNTIVQNRFLNPEVAAKIATSSRNVFQEQGEFYASTLTVDAFVAEVLAADPDPEGSRQVHIDRIKAKNQAMRDL